MICFLMATTNLLGGYGSLLNEKWGLNLTGWNKFICHLGLS